LDPILGVNSVYLGPKKNVVIHLYMLATLKATTSTYIKQAKKMLL